MTGPAPVPRRPLLPATFRGVAAVWLWRRVKEDAKGAPAAVRAAGASEQAVRELACSLAELEEAARQWAERFREVEGSGSGTAELVSAEPDARSGHELTTTEAAALLGVSDSLVRRWCREGRLVAVQRGGLWVIDRGSVGDLLDARRSAA